MVPSNKVPPLLTLYLIAKHDRKKCELGGQRFIPTGRKVEGYYYSTSQRRRRACLLVKKLLNYHWDTEKGILALRRYMCEASTLPFVFVWWFQLNACYESSGGVDDSNNISVLFSLLPSPWTLCFCTFGRLHQKKVLEMDTPLHSVFSPLLLLLARPIKYVVCRNEGGKCWGWMLYLENTHFNMFQWNWIILRSYIPSSTFKFAFTGKQNRCQ